MLHINVNTASFLRDQFQSYGRDQYTYCAYEFFVENLEGELDVVGICCDWYEYDYHELTREYKILADCEDLDDCMEILSDCTRAFETDNKILFVVF
jgi:hypothetical protein